MNEFRENRDEIVARAVREAMDGLEHLYPTIREAPEVRRIPAKPSNVNRYERRSDGLGRLLLAIPFGIISVLITFYVLSLIF